MTAHPLVIGGTSIPNRWLVAIMGTLLQVCLGTVYAWSYFQMPVVETFRCSQSQAAWAFSLAIGFLGVAAAWGGVNLPRFGPTRLAMTGGTFYALGYLLAAGAIHLQCRLGFYLGFGVIGGIGLGLGYVTPVATAAKWFPDKKGLVTGMVVMGFGFGALVMSKLIAPFLMAHFNGNLVPVFVCIGLLMLGLTLATGWFLRNPPADFVPAGWVPPRPVAGTAANGEPPLAGACLRSSQFIFMWLIFFCNITAGIMFIGFQSPMIQDLMKERYPELTAAQLTAAGATLIAISSVCNGVGRFFWGGLSDRLGRLPAFRLILVSQILVFIALLWVRHPWIFGICVCYVLLCYGGGFGTMPAFVLDVFGAVRMPVVYGALLTAWSLAGIVGPQLAAVIKDLFPMQASTYTFATAAVLLGAGLLAAGFLNTEPMKS